MGYFVVGLEQQHRVNAVGWELRIVGIAEDRLDVLELFFFRALLNIIDCFPVDVHSIDRARSGDAARSAHCEPARSGTDVGYVFTGLNAKHIHDAVDLEALFAPWSIENGEIARVRAASLALGRRRWGFGLTTHGHRAP